MVEALERAIQALADGKSYEEALDTVPAPIKEDLRLLVAASAFTLQAVRQQQPAPTDDGADKKPPKGKE